VPPNRFVILVAALAAIAPAWGQPVVQAVVNGASYSGNIAPGTWVSIFGTDLSTAMVTAAGVPLQTTLGGVSVTFNGIAAPLSYVSPTQINAVVPFEIQILPNPSPPVTVPVVVTTSAGPSVPRIISLSRESPGLFTENGAGTGAVIAFNGSFQPVSVLAGGPIVLYADGLGPTNPPASSASGGASTAPFNMVADSPTVFVGDTQATVLFAGLAPGFPGIYQLNVMPNGPISDRVYIQVNGWQSNVVSLPIAPGTNVANVSGAINGLYPPTFAPVTASAMLIAGTFSVSFDILPTAVPFSIVAAGEGGNAVIQINPASGTWQATLSEPRLPPVAGDFSEAFSGFNVLWDFLSCQSNGMCLPFPGNVIPLSRIDPAQVQAVAQLPQGIACSTCAGANGTYSASGVLPAGGHFSIGPSSLSNLANFGGFIQIAEVGTASRTTSFHLYVDGKLIASKDVSYKVSQP
jgi:uncharacterized protein (TIGR03437 family)